MFNYTAFDVSCHIVNTSIDANDPVSNLQLQKILYFVQVGYFSEKSKWLFEDDFEAWQYGPVVPGIYRLFSIWGGGKITRKPTAPHKQISSEDSCVIDPIIKVCRAKAPWALVEQAHAEGSPWKRTMDLRGDSAIISKDLISSAS
ncbi:Panacea domain-containing protein [Adlercreutzia muris]|uniref:DUF4065 domain-containing protein n=1 Tax=Adlercreutzia muris TaxID=1796610 RepID=A0A7C8FSE6_9ACTN|nr:type II toxin-antitoxin system antitoxin SocA domain-containing protein [Adlercreutzia muris]KAB1640040.1 DUF4065 domain-containing protein [Adlercreutzia muris]MCR2029253.1 DUF4065 domain-containing protein [Adlercreutzia muris]